MPNYKVSGSDLTSVANAIRTKGGTSASLSFPDEFVSAIGDIPTGGGSTLIAKNITANGTYNAADDNADGYSTVNVNVASRLVTGTFTGTTAQKGTAITIPIPYTGNGYPTNLMIFPSAGTATSGSDISTVVQKSVIIMHSICKNDISATPTYNDTTSTANMGSVLAIYKSSTTDASANTSNRAFNEVIYRNINATQSYATAAIFKDNTTLSVMIADTLYGFLAGTEYTYMVVYSE